MTNNSILDFPQTDIYIIDQIMRGRIKSGMRILDAACGGGRNIPILLHLGCDVTAFDAHQSAVAQCTNLYPEISVQQCDLHDFHSDPVFDMVIANAVFHFAPNYESFIQWANTLWNSLAPNGIFFARLSTTISL